MVQRSEISESDKAELAGLRKAISDVEKTLVSMPPGTRPFFTGFLLNAKTRVGILEKKIQEEERASQERSRNEVALSSLAQSETRLDAKEQAIYDGFLAKDFFTKSDFPALERFYKETWERLSEGGKDELSHRIWEGIRHREYEFSDLPTVVQEKEAKRAYTVLKKREAEQKSAGRIPAPDRQDFIEAYESGDVGSAVKVLARPTFREEMFRHVNSGAVQHREITASKEADQAGVMKEANRATEKTQDLAAPKDALGDFDLSSIKLSAIREARDPSDGLVTSLLKDWADRGRSS